MLLVGHDRLLAVARFGHHLLHLGILGPLRTDVGVRASDLSAMPCGLRLFPIS